MVVHILGERVNKMRFSRTELLLGKCCMDRLKQSRIAVFGIGGVGGHVVEALVRSGIGFIDLIDKDVVDISNINRQIIAADSTVGRYKTELAKERIFDINPNCVVNEYQYFYLPEDRRDFDFSKYDYVVDAVDTVSAKLDIVKRCMVCNTRIISAMGVGNKLDPSKLFIADIYETSVCALARVMRRELRASGVEHLKVLYSTEKAISSNNALIDEDSGKVVNASVAWMPAIAGLIIAAEVVKDLCAGI